MTDTWAAAQQRRFNLATFQQQPKEPRRRRRYRFTQAQLEIAVAVLEQDERKK